MSQRQPMLSNCRQGLYQEGYYADLVIVDPAKNFVVSKENILYMRRSPFESFRFPASVYPYFCKWPAGLWKWNRDESVKGEKT
jgi:dihydroorotase